MNHVLHIHSERQYLQGWDNMRSTGTCVSIYMYVDTPGKEKLKMLCRSRSQKYTKRKISIMRDMCS
jgi:hypothetical protein